MKVHVEIDCTPEEARAFMGLPDLTKAQAAYSESMEKAMHDGLDDHPKVTLYDYEGMDHGFATQFGKRRDEENAQLADKRTMEFFAEHLG